MMQDSIIREVLNERQNQLRNVVARWKYQSGKRVQRLRGELNSLIKTPYKDDALGGKKIHAERTARSRGHVRHRDESVQDPVFFLYDEIRVFNGRGSSVNGIFVVSEKSIHGERSRTLIAAEPREDCFFRSWFLMRARSRAAMRRVLDTADKAVQLARICSGMR